MPYHDGDLIQLKTVEPFTDEINNEPTDPNVVLVLWRVNFGPTTTWRYGVDAQVLRDGVGLYRVDWDSTGSAPQSQSTLTYRFSGDPDGSGESQVCMAQDWKTLTIDPLPI